MTGDPMGEYDDWNAKIIEEFRANDGKVGGQFEGAPGPSCTTAAAPKGIRTIPCSPWLAPDEHVGP